MKIPPYGSGDMDALRDTFVSFLLTTILERTDKQQLVMDKVSLKLNAMRHEIISCEEANILLDRINILNEIDILRAISVIAGDERTMVLFIQVCNKLTFQLIRPAPRLRRTKQIFNDVVTAWRYATGFHFRKWENILQLNAAVILKEIPVIRSESAGAKSFIDKIKELLPSEDTSND